MIIKIKIFIKQNRENDGHERALGMVFFSFYGW